MTALSDVLQIVCLPLIPEITSRNYKLKIKSTRAMIKLILVHSFFIGVK